MDFSHSRRNELLSPAWQFTATGVIWRFMLAEGGRIIGEDRDLEHIKASFFCLEESTGAVRWKDRSYGEDWWTGIETVEGDVLFLHGFATPALPVHRGLVAVDVATGERLWGAPHYSFLGASGGRVLVESREASGSFRYELESRSGRIVESLLQNRQWGEDRSHPEQPPETSVKSPLPLESLEEISTAAKAALVAQQEDGSQALEGLCDSGFLVLALQDVQRESTGRPGLVNHRIVAINQRSGRIVYRDRLADGISAAVRPTFFAWTDVLHYVKDRKTLIAVRLLPEG